MKRICSTALALLLPLISLHSQSRQSADEFAALPVEEAKKAMDDPSQFTKLTSSQLVAAALRSQRMDLLTFCFNNNDLGWPLYEQTAALPESTFKDRVQTMMLHNNKDFWGLDPEEIVTFMGGRDYNEAADTFRPLVKKYFTNMAVTAETIRRRAARSKLATDLEAAIAKQEEKAPNSATPTAPTAMPPPASSVEPPATPKSQSAKINESAPPVSSEPVSQGHSVMLWLLAIIAAITGPWFFMRQK